jgi:hypothetical protein
MSVILLLAIEATRFGSLGWLFERSTHTQTKIQGLSVYFTAQRSRLVQVWGRVNSIWKDWM